MSDFQTRSTLEGMGAGEEVGPRHSEDLDIVGDYPDRDALTDAARMGDASSHTAATIGHQSDARATTTADEDRRGGFSKLTVPVGGKPEPRTTAGMRGDCGADGIPDDD